MIDEKIIFKSDQSYNHLEVFLFHPFVLSCYLSTERIIDAILTATKNYGLGPDLDG